MDKKIKIATCALLLGLAKIDDDFSLIEKNKIRKVLIHDLGVKKEDVEELIELADKVQSESIDTWHFTNLLNEYYSNEEKLKILEVAWKIVYADSRLDSYEDHLMHKIADLLHLSHKELIEAKLKVKGER